MKKWIAAAGLFAAVLCLSACVPREKAVAPETTAVPETTEVVTEEMTTEAETAQAEESGTSEIGVPTNSTGFAGVGSVEIKKPEPKDVAAERGLTVSMEFTETEEVVYAVSQLNLRVIPDAAEDSTIYTTILPGTKMERTGKADVWSRVVYEDMILYASTEILSTEEPAATTGKVICIDPGHQSVQNTETEPLGPGSTEMKKKVASGTAGVKSGLNEYELNLAVGLKLQAELEKRGYTVIMTRTTHDVNTSNAERAEMANEAGAAVFVRIHADGSEDKTAEGISTICPTKENPYEVGKLYDQCYQLSSDILDAMVEATGAKKRNIWETDTMSGINWSKVPVTIIEMGFMSNPTEDQKMATEEYQDLLVTGIANGIDKYLESQQ